MLDGTLDGAILHERGVLAQVHTSDWADGASFEVLQQRRPLKGGPVMGKNGVHKHFLHRHADDS